MTPRDTSSVFHISILDADIQAERDQSLPWVFEFDGTQGPDQNSFATEEEACGAQRAYRRERGFNEDDQMLDARTRSILKDARHAILWLSNPQLRERGEDRLPRTDIVEAIDALLQETETTAA